MKTFFDITAKRSVNEALELLYRRPEQHPSRKSPPFHDIVYMVEGKWSFEVFGRTFNVVPGDVFILPAGSVYNGAGECPAGTRTLFIHADAAENDFTGEPEQAPSSDKLIPLDVVVHCQNEPAIKTLFSEIAMINGTDAPGKQEVKLALWNALVCMINRCERKNLVCKNNFVTRCLEIMSERRDVLFKESEMAAMLFISTKTLRNGFVRHFNKTFYKYQLDLKLSLAQSMLIQDPDIKTYEVAYSLGFGDEFHFSKLFKKKFGVSPSEYKKNVKAFM